MRKLFPIPVIVPARLRRKAFWGALFGLFLYVAPVFAALNTPLIFGRKETFGIGPRAMGMGGAFVAVADDASAVYWNVAGLAQISSYEISASSAPMYFRSDFGNVAPPPPATNGGRAFGFPWYASLQLIIPVAKENTLAISLFRPFHPQMDLFLGNPLPSSNKINASYLLNPSFQENVIALSYAARFSAVQNFSVGVNVKRITNDQFYIWPFSRDALPAGYAPLNALDKPVLVEGFAVDVGLLYRIPITKYSEEFRIGLSLNDLVSSATFTNGLQLQTPELPTPLVNFPYGAGFSTPIPPLVTLGFAYKNNYLFKVRNITAFDISQISDARFTDANNKFLHFGTEFWLFKDVLGVRAGYSSPISRPGTISLGLSVRALSGNFQGDLAFLQPISEIATIGSSSDIATLVGGINFEKFHIGATYRFGGRDELPPPKVGAFVTPPSFTPSRGEKSVFNLDTTEDVTVNRWSVLIYDPSNKLVRSLRGKGSPPAKLSWQGENDLYEPLAPGVYTWAFQVHDQLDHVGSTPVQTVEILAPPDTREPVKDPAKLLAMRKQQEALLIQERQQLTALAQESLKKLLGVPEATPTTATSLATPGEAYGNTMVPEAGGVPVLGFNNVTQDAVLNAHFDKNANGEPIVVVAYKSNLTFVPYLYNEAAEVIKTAVNSVGTGLKEVSTRVYYGKNELTLRTPTQTAANYASGRIDRLTLLQLSDIHINGVKVGPNGY